MFTNYFKTAWRYMIRNKVSSIINVLGLSFGLTFCLIVFLMLQHETSYDRFHPDSNRIYRLTSEMSFQGRTRAGSGMLNPMLESVREEITGLEKTVLFFNYNSKIRITDGTTEKYFEEPRWGIDPFEVIITDPAYFDIFRYEWLSGSPAALNEPFAVVLTADKARLYFGDMPVEKYIGKEIRYGEDLRVTVTGIVKAWKQKTDFIFTDFISYSTIPGSELKDRFNMEAWGMWSNNTQVYLKLLPGVDKKIVEDRFSPWAKKYVLGPPDMEVNMFLQPLADIHFNSDYNDAYSHQAHLPTLYGLMAIAAFILIIAVCNFINLSTAQSLQRTKEVGVRKVFGGKRANLMTQFLGETLLVTLCAALFSVLLARISINLFQSFVPVGLQAGLASPFTWLFLLATVLCTTLLAGIYPARFMSGASPMTVMSGSSQQGATKGLLRKSLIVFQFSISLILLICTMVIGDQLHYMLNKDMGFVREAIINIRIRGNREVLAERIKQFPYVERTSIHTVPPAATGHNGTVFWYTRDGERQEANGQIEFCDEHFIPLYGLQLVAGRNLLPSSYMREFVVNESFARQLGYNDPQDAIGQLIESGQIDRVPDDVPPSSGPRQMQIVGVVSDFHSMSLHEKINPIVMSATTQAGRTLSVKVVASGNMKQILSDMEKTWKDVNPYERLEMTFFDDSIAAFYEKEQKTMKIINAAMMMGIFISCMGLFGLVLFTTRQRTKEIGIRKVLGAGTGSILTLLSGGFVKLVLIAAVIASPIAWYAMTKWLEGFAYHVPVRWWIFVLATVSALAIALATVFLQAYKAATANPINAIKSE